MESPRRVMNFRFRIFYRDSFSESYGVDHKMNSPRELNVNYEPTAYKSSCSRDTHKNHDTGVKYILYGTDPRITFVHNPTDFIFAASIDPENVIPRRLSPDVLSALQGVRFIAQQIKNTDKDNEVG